MTLIETNNEGRLPQKNSFLRVDSSHVCVSAVKQAEDGQGVIVRAYETKKQEGKAVLKLPFMDREAELAFTPCEIKTIYFPYDHSKPWHEVNMLEW